MALLDARPATSAMGGHVDSPSFVAGRRRHHEIEIAVQIEVAPGRMGPLVAPKTGRCFKFGADRPPVAGVEVESSGPARFVVSVNAQDVEVSIAVDVCEGQES